MMESGAGVPLVPAVMAIDSNKNIVGLSFEGTCEIAGQCCYMMHTTQSDLSTVNKEADNYSSNYDHFTYDDRTGRDVVQGVPHRLNVVEKAGGFSPYKEKISDHIPVMLEIDLR